MLKETIKKKNQPEEDAFPLKKKKKVQLGKCH